MYVPLYRTLIYAIHMYIIYIGLRKAELYLITLVTVKAVCVLIFIS